MTRGDAGVRLSAVRPGGSSVNHNLFNFILSAESAVAGTVHEGFPLEGDEGWGLVRRGKRSSCETSASSRLTAAAKERVRIKSGGKEIADVNKPQTEAVSAGSKSKSSMGDIDMDEEDEEPRMMSCQEIVEFLTIKPPGGGVAATTTSAGGA